MPEAELGESSLCKLTSLRAAYGSALERVVKANIRYFGFYICRRLGWAS
jgi:hypothetical protein